MKKIILFFLVLLTSISCTETSIEFAVKADFTLDVIVDIDAPYGTRLVDKFDTESEIDLSDRIDEVKNISSLLVTGVKLQLEGYLPSFTFGGNTAYHDDPLVGDLKVFLVDGDSEKILYDGRVNFGTNQEVDQVYNSRVEKEAPIVELDITETQAKELIRNNKVKLRLEMANGEIKDDYDFRFKMTVLTEAITEF